MAGINQSQWAIQMRGGHFVERGLGILIRSYQENTGGFQKIRVINFFQWWRLMLNPAKQNELLSVELSWAWEPMYSKRAC